ncbi:MAG: PQQ-dependent sugar dehydrogenase [Rhizobiaceae bacterium]
MVPRFSLPARARLPQWMAALALSGISLTLASIAMAEGTTFETQKGPVVAEVVADGFDHPWAMAMLPDGAILVTERSGSLWLVRNGEKSPVDGVPPVAAVGQGGLLDIVADEEFRETRRLWFTWSKAGPQGFATTLSTATLSQDESQLDGVTELFTMNKASMTGHHFGSRIVLAPDNKLFITIGERGEGMRAQDPFDHAGSLIRLNRDGSLPSDNPYANGRDGLPEIWSKGHRNPQGAAWDKVSGRLWTVEHGAMGGDEINRPEPGLNYGWPIIAYGRNYDGTKIGKGFEAEGYQQPTYYWDPSIAPSGMAFYEGTLHPRWQGDLFVGALKYQMVVRLGILDGAVFSEERLFEGAFGRIRDVRAFADGALWLLTDEDNAQLIRIVATGQ